jgi:hypothetical protein
MVTSVLAIHLLLKCVLLDSLQAALVLEQQAIARLVNKDSSAQILLLVFNAPLELIAPFSLQVKL